MLRKLKGNLERISGVRFSLKTFRAIMAQQAKDRGAFIEAVSKALRHSNTRTTEDYYARIRTDDAFAELEEAFGSWFAFGLVLNPRLNWGINARARI